MARILFVNTRYRPPYFRGGVERYVHVLGNAFARLGHDAEVVAFEEPLGCESKVPHRFISVARIPFLRPLLFSWKGRSLWRRADLIVLQYTPLGLLMPRDKLVCTVHTTGYGEVGALNQTRGYGAAEWWKRARRRITLPFERRVLERAEKIIAISEQIADELVAAYKIPRERIAVVGNGVDCGEFRPDGIPKGRSPLRLLYVGRLAPRKNVDLLVRAVAMCESKPQLRIVGVGPELAKIKDLAAQLSLAGQVTFCGFRKGDDLLAEYHWADVLVMPSSYEGMPLVALEAKASGLPIIAADFRGAESIVTEASGRIVRGIRSDLLALAVDEVASDPTKIKHMAECARREAVSNFSWESVVAKLTAQYGSVLGQRNGIDMYGDPGDGRDPL